MKSHFKSEFLKNVLTMVTGTAMAQSIPVILQPILRRLFDPAEFGLFAVYLSIIGMFSVITNARYEMAIVVADDDSKAMSVFKGTVIINFCMSLFYLIVIFLFYDWWVQILNIDPSFGYVLYYTPLSIFLLSLGVSANNVLIRKKEFKRSTMNKLYRRSSEGAVQTGGGFVKLNTGLVFGDLIGHIFSLSILFFDFKKKGYFLIKNSFHEIRNALKIYAHFPKYNALPTLLNSVSLLLPVMIINSKYAMEDTGQFDLSRQMLALPIVLVSASISQVLFQKISEKKKNKMSIKKDLKKVFVSLSAISLFAIIVFYLIGIDLFEFIFGKEWRTAAIFTEILIISYAIKFVVNTLSIVLTSLEKLRILASWQILYFILITLLSFISDIDIYLFLKIYVLIDVFSYLLYALIIYWEVNKYEKDLSH